MGSARSRKRSGTGKWPRPCGRIDTMMLYNAACTYGILKKKQEALDTLKKAIECGYGNLEWIKQDPDLLLLRDDPEFQKLVSRGQAA